MKVMQYIASVYTRSTLGNEKRNMSGGEWVRLATGEENFSRSLSCPAPWKWRWKSAAERAFSEQFSASTFEAGWNEVVAISSGT